jgi:hypothetical protein
MMSLPIRDCFVGREASQGRELEKVRRMRELSVLAQQADEPVKSIATPPIRRA